MHVRPITPALLRALLLGTLGAPIHGCGGTSTGREPEQVTSSTACTLETPLLSGVETGIYRCQEGYLHRARARECPSTLPRDRIVEWPNAIPDGGANDAGIITDAGNRVDECERDSDCAGANAHCELVYPTLPTCALAPPPQQASRICVPGCRVDSDCGASKVCICGADIGYCAPVSDISGCHTDADCAGSVCIQNARSDTFGGYSFACQLAGDRCETDADCSYPDFCSISDTGRKCQPGAVCGRPFLVGQEVRLAKALSSSTWNASERAAFPVDAALARRLAEHWTRIGLMEHASVAAFARFALQLLSLGAPADLVRDAIAAQSDEMRHATLAFELASAYGGSPVGPGPLPLEGALAQTSAEEILRLTIREGCIGETRAALEAAEAARRADVPWVKAALERIAGDESEHAALAWKCAKWILSEHPELARVAAEELSIPRSEHSLTALARLESEGEAHGLLDERMILRLHHVAMREVITPCAEALLGVAHCAQARLGRS